MANDIIYLEKNMRNNIIYSYVSQFFLAAAGIVTLPFLLNRMGAELYAFVAIFFTIQTIFSILDGGLSGSLSREFALNREKTTRIYNPKILFKKTELIFIGLSLSGALIIYFLSEFISTSWVKLETISVENSKLHIILIGFIAALRLWSGLYRAVLIGYEQQKNLSIINILITSARYIFVLPLLNVIDNMGLSYFVYQFIIAIMEVVLLRFFANINICNESDLENFKQFDFEYFEKILRNSLQIWVLTLIWVATNQLDKVILSGLISLQKFGLFSIVSSLSSGILLLGAPVANAVMPKLARCIKVNDNKAAIKIYFRASKLLSILGFSTAFTMAILPEHILYLFVNDVQVAEDFSESMRFYSIGSFFLLMSGTTFLLRQSAGELNLNIKQNFYYFLVMLVAMLIGANYSGLNGTAIAWFFSNLILIFMFVKPLNFIGEVNFHWSWIRSVVCVPLMLSIPAFICALFFNQPISSWYSSFLLLVATFICIVVSCAFPEIYSRLIILRNRF